MEIKRTCFCCEKQLTGTEILDKDDFSNPPNDATYWRTRGNWGSTVFDGGDFTGESLEMFICDECLKAKAHLVYHFRTEKQQPQVVDLKLFSEVMNDPGEYDGL